MGLTLTNLQIDQTYPGLIKTTDNAVIDATLKALTDGVGTELPIEVSTTGINFTGTVTGISAGGLVQGSAGINSLKSADGLSSNPNNATGGDSIAIGNGTSAQSNCISLGVGTTAENGPAIAIGRYSTANGSVTTAMGNSANVNGDHSIGLSGEVISVNGIRNVGIGRQVNITGQNNVAIGNYTQVTATATIAMQTSRVSAGTVSSDNSVVIVPGQYAANITSAASNSVVLGSSFGNTDRANSEGSIAIGYNTKSQAVGAVALGYEVFASRANTTSVEELETKTVGGGVVMYSPNGTGYKLTVSDAGAAVFTAI